MGIWYATREQCTRSLEIANTSRAAPIIDRYLETSSRALEQTLHRRFYPEIKSVSFDWPGRDYSPTYRLDLGINEIISLTSFTSGGTALLPSEYILRRWDNRNEPPYQYIEINQAGSGAFQSGDTYQQALVLTGLFGFQDTDTSLAGASLGASVNSSATSFVLNPTDGYFTPGVGSLILIGTERVQVVQRSMRDTAVNTAGTLTDRQADKTLAVADASGFAIDEIILVDAERMRIDDIAGNNLLVTRAFDGSQLASHASGADIYALRTFTVRRGVLGTSASSHTQGDAAYVHTYPGPVNELCIASTIVGVEQNAATYARTIGSGNSGSSQASTREASGKGLIEIQEMAYWSYGRTQRSTGV